MKRSRFTEDQISYALKLVEQGQPVKDVCRQFVIAEAGLTRVWLTPHDLIGLPTVH